MNAMKYFKDDKNVVYAYAADGSQDAFIKVGLVSISKDEADALRAPAPKTIEEIRASMRCSRWQFKRALTQLGLRTEVEALVLEADQDTKDMWNDAQMFFRLHPFILSSALMLNKSAEQIDEVFLRAIDIVD